LTRNPILEVLFTFGSFEVRSLLIGGQASIIYGAAEFSRDADFSVLASAANLSRLEKALSDLKAENIYVPPFRKKYLDRGHACHFRCGEGAAAGIRIDIMSKMRGCDDFSELWKRRYTVKTEEGKSIQVISLEDLVQSKKTQRDKDWLMIDRLIRNDIILADNPSPAKIRWWILECRDPDILINLTKDNRAAAEKLVTRRPLIEYAVKKNSGCLKAEIKSEEEAEREKDRQYWAPLRKGLESLRRLEVKKPSR
jgi:hypothetical protein